MWSKLSSSARLEASVLWPPTLSHFLLSSPNTRRHPRHARPAARVPPTSRDPFATLPWQHAWPVPRWPMAVEGPGLGVLMDACLASVPTAALTSSAAKVILCKPITCKWCGALRLPPGTTSLPSRLFLFSLLAGCGGKGWSLWLHTAAVPTGSTKETLRPTVPHLVRWLLTGAMICSHSFSFFPEVVVKPSEMIQSPQRRLHSSCFSVLFSDPFCIRQQF